jgi:iron complex outermembrane receptor protein
MKLIRLSWLLGVFFWTLTGIRARAQPGAIATIAATVQSEADVPLAGVSVVALHLPTGRQHVATSNERGLCSVDALPSGGPYVLQIIQPGFRSQVVTNVYLMPGGPINLDFKMVPKVLATDARHRTSADATGPVDIIDAASQPLSSSYSDLTQALHYSAPSFISPTRPTTADEAHHTAPAGTAAPRRSQRPELGNGSRQPTAALTNPLGNRGVGRAGYHLNALTMSGPDQLQVRPDSRQ